MVIQTIMFIIRNLPLPKIISNGLVGSHALSKISFKTGSVYIFYVDVKFIHLTPKNQGIVELLELFSGENVTALKSLFILSDTLTINEFIEFLKFGNADPDVIKEISELPKCTTKEQLYEQASDFADKYGPIVDDFNKKYTIPSPDFNPKEKIELIEGYVSTLDPVLEPGLKKDLKNGLENFNEVIVDCENENSSSRHASTSSDVSLSSFFNPSKIVKR